MIRYLRVTFVIGLLAALLALGAYHFGIVRLPDARVLELLGLPEYMAALRWPYMYALLPLLAFVVAWTTVDITRNSLKAVVAMGLLLQMFATSWVASLFGHFFAPTGPVIAVLSSFLFGLLYSRTSGGGRKRMLRHVFGSRVSPAVFRTMVDGSVPDSMEGEKLDGTVLVCEVFNHPELMEDLPIREYVEMINLYLTAASGFLVDRSAYLDECDGESVRVLFGAPLPDTDHAANAVCAAMELDARLKNLNAEFDARWHRTLDCRIGLCSGALITGTYGSGLHGGYSAAGEAVDLARRLCAANTVFGTHILLAPTTQELIMDKVEVRPIEMVRRAVDGERMEIYEPLGVVGDLTDADRTKQGLSWEGVIFYRERHLDLAFERFQRVAESGDPVADFYLHRIERLRTGSSAVEPGVFRQFGAV